MRGLSIGMVCDHGHNGHGYVSKTDYKKRNDEHNPIIPYFDPALGKMIVPERRRRIDN